MRSIFNFWKWSWCPSCKMMRRFLLFLILFRIVSIRIGWIDEIVIPNTCRQFPRLSFIEILLGVKIRKDWLVGISFCFGNFHWNFSWIFRLITYLDKCCLIFLHIVNGLQRDSTHPNLLICLYIHFNIINLNFFLKLC